MNTLQWQPVDLTHYLTGDGPTGPQPEHLLADDGQPTFAPGTNNTIVGDPESGKTWVLLAAGAERLQAGGSFAFVDLDHNGPNATISRLRTLAVPDELIGNPDKFMYVDPEDGQALDEAITALIDRNTDLVGVDSIGELMPLYGASSNSPDEFTAVNRRVNARLARAGVCVIGIDHLAKGEESRKLGPTGTLAKKRAVDGILIRCTVATAYAPGKGGSSHLTLEKDRHGVLRAARYDGDKRPLVGTFQLFSQPYAGKAWNLIAPKDGRNPVEDPDDADKAAVLALDPAPTTVKEARERLGWRMDRASRVMRWLRKQSTTGLPVTESYRVTGNEGGSSWVTPGNAPVTHLEISAETQGKQALPYPSIRGVVTGNAHEEPALPITRPLGKETGNGYGQSTTVTATEIRNSQNENSKYKERATTSFPTPGGDGPRVYPFNAYCTDCQKTFGPNAAVCPDCKGAIIPPGVEVPQ